MTVAVSEIVSDSMRAWRPPARLSLSEWSDEHYYLSAESAAEPGWWRTLPYQRGMMDAITDPNVTRVSVMKSARVGFTKILNATVGYYMHQDPCPIMVVQPTIEDAQGYSKEEIVPMLRDCPVLAELVPETKSKDSDQTILHKAFPGGSISLVGANSGRGFRRVSRKVVIFDEVDGYPPSAGNEGDQIRLGIKRAEYYWDRKIVAGSTPLTAGASRIEEMFMAGDQRRYFVPCPHCGHMDFFVFRESFTLGGEPAGHFMSWPDGKPDEAHFVCRECGADIEHKHKRDMIERGEWRTFAESRGHASFHIWAAYSFSPNATWADIAREHDDAEAAGLQALRTFVNTVLGETWSDKGDAPDYSRLLFRREQYPVGTVPSGVDFITAGVDVQNKRLVYEVVGWSIADKQSWSIEASELHGDTATESAPVWRALHALLERGWPGAAGVSHTIRALAVDSGFNTNTVYNWARSYPRDRVMATKGVSSLRSLFRAPSDVDVNTNGKRLARAYKVWPIGVDVAKSELYGWLRLEIPEPGSPYPIGFCHFPEYDEEFFKQLTAEQLVAVTDGTGHTAFRWHVLPGRQNHFLDCRILARAAASVLGLDRARKSAPPPTSSPDPAPAPATPNAFSSNHSQPARTSDWLGGRGKDFFKRRR